MVRAATRRMGSYVGSPTILEFKFHFGLSHALVSAEHSDRDPAHRLHGPNPAMLRPGIDQGHAVVDGRSCLHCWRPGSANEKTNPLGQFAAGSKAFRSPQNVISISRELESRGSIHLLGYR